MLKKINNGNRNFKWLKSLYLQILWGVMKLQCKHSKYGCPGETIKSHLLNLEGWN